MPDANSAKRTLSCARFRQASGTGGGRMGAWIVVITLRRDDRRRTTRTIERSHLGSDSSAVITAERDDYYQNKSAGSAAWTFRTARSPDARHIPDVSASTPSAVSSVMTVGMPP